MAQPHPGLAGGHRVYLPLLTPCCQAPLIEYQENLLGWYVPYCEDWADGAGLGEEDIFQP